MSTLFASQPAINQPTVYTWADPAPLSARFCEILLAIGYRPEFYPASYEDVGGPESGPHVIGDPEVLVYRLDAHMVVVEDGGVVEISEDPFFDYLSNDEDQF